MKKLFYLLSFIILLNACDTEETITIYNEDTTTYFTYNIINHYKETVAYKLFENNYIQISSYEYKNFDTNIKVGLHYSGDIIDYVDYTIADSLDYTTFFTELHDNLEFNAEDSTWIEYVYDNYENIWTLTYFDHNYRIHVEAFK